MTLLHVVAVFSNDCDAFDDCEAEDVDRAVAEDVAVRVDRTVTTVAVEHRVYRDDLVKVDLALTEPIVVIVVVDNDDPVDVSDFVDVILGVGVYRDDLVKVDLALTEPIVVIVVVANDDPVDVSDFVDVILGVGLRVPV